MVHPPGAYLFQIPGSHFFEMIDEKPFSLLPLPLGKSQGEGIFNGTTLCDCPHPEAYEIDSPSLSMYGPDNPKVLEIKR